MSLLPVLNALIPVRRHPIRPHDFALSDPARLPQVCRHPCPRNPRIFPFLSSDWVEAQPSDLRLPSSWGAASPLNNMINRPSLTSVRSETAGYL